MTVLTNNEEALARRVETRLRSEWPGTSIPLRSGYIPEVVRDGGATDTLIKLAVRIVAEESARRLPVSGDNTEARVESLTAFIETWYDRRVDPDHSWVASDLAEDIMEWQASQSREVEVTDELRDAIEHIRGGLEYQDAINPAAVEVVIAAALGGGDHAE